MSTVSIIYNERKANKKGEVPIWLRIIKDRKTKYIALGIRVPREQWNFDDNKVRKSHPHYKILNKTIAEKVAKAEGITYEMENDITRYTTSGKIKDSLLGRSSESFLKYADKFISKLSKTDRVGNYYKYVGVIKKLRKYLKGKDLAFCEITVSFLKDYEQHLSEELKNHPNTIHSNLKTIRKLMNDAVREDIVPIDKNPFYKYKLKLVKTERHYISEEEIKIIENKVITDSPRVKVARDMFIFACYAGGMRISDVLRLKWENYDGERIVMKTKKTSDILSIKVPNKAKAIMESYFTDKSKSDHFVFPVMKNYVDYSEPKKLYDSLATAKSIVNTDLEKLEKMCELNLNLHFHLSRHSFAVIALKKGMRIEYLSKILTHSDIKTTQVYAKIVSSELDKAMDIFND